MAAAPTPPGTLSAGDLAGLSEDARARLLERNPHLADALAPPKAKPSRKAPAKAPDDPPAAPRAPRSGSPRRKSGTARRAAARVARQTPGVPGPSATNLALSFIGATVLTMGLVIVVGNGDRLGFLPGALGTATARLIDPADPIF